MVTAMPVGNDLLKNNFGILESASHEPSYGTASESYLTVSHSHLFRQSLTVFLFFY
jgi:hypothetical protein